MSPTLTPRSRAIAVACLAVIAGALALVFGGWVGDTVRAHHATDTTTSSSVYVAPDPYVYVGDSPAESAESWAVDSATDGATPDDPTDDCIPYRLADHDRAVAEGITYPGLWDELMALGWHGDPADGMEALYAPECGAVQQ